jgi:hypothetical protein
MLRQFATSVNGMAGADYAMKRIPRAVLQKTPLGFAFLTPTVEGTSCFEFNSQGQPVVGARRPRAGGSQATFPGGSELFLTYQNENPPGLAVEWFGIAQNGDLYSARAVSRARK